MTTNPNLERDVHNQILYNKYLKGDRFALDDLCSGVYMMVCSMVNRAVPGNESNPAFEYYFTAAQKAVVKAASKWNPERGNSWPSYCYHQIRSAINHEHVHQNSLREKGVEAWSIDDLGGHHKTDDETNDFYLFPDPSKFEEDFEVRWSVDDFIKSANLTPEQVSILWGSLEGNTLPEMAEDLGCHTNRVILQKKTIREKFTKYLEDARKIYKSEELDLE